MSQIIIDFLLPKTDAGVYFQWASGLIFWLIVIFLTRKKQKDIRLLIYGLAIFNCAWFAIRTLH